MVQLLLTTLLATLSGNPLGSPEMVPMDTPLTSRGFERIGTYYGVTVYEHEDPDTIHIAAEGRFAHSPEKVRQVLLDYDKHAGQVERVSESRILSKGQDRMRVYQRLEMPLIDDRDFNLLVRWGDTKSILWIHYRACGPGRPAKRGVVRLSHHRGSWQLKSIRGGNATLARYQSDIDLGGMLPLWMARSRAGEAVPDMFAGLRRMLVQAQR